MTVFKPGNGGSRGISARPDTADVTFFRPHEPLAPNAARLVPAPKDDAASRRMEERKSVYRMYEIAGTQEVFATSWGQIVDRSNIRGFSLPMKKGLQEKWLAFDLFVTRTGFILVGPKLPISLYDDEDKRYMDVELKKLEYLKLKPDSTGLTSEPETIYAADISLNDLTMMMKIVQTAKKKEAAAKPLSQSAEPSEQRISLAAITEALAEAQKVEPQSGTLFPVKVAKDDSVTQDVFRARLKNATALAIGRKSIDLDSFADGISLVVLRKSANNGELYYYLLDGEMNAYRLYVDVNQNDLRTRIPPGEVNLLSASMFKHAESGAGFCILCPEKIYGNDIEVRNIA